MNYLAKLLYLGGDVEEEALLRIRDMEITCFVALCLFNIEEGQSYEVDLNAQIFDEYLVRELDKDSSPGIVRVGRSFSYIIKGRLTEKCLDVGGIRFFDDVLLSEFGHLQGKMIEWKVDRIDAIFLSEY
ncbi:hypothetical protein [Herbaspirillum rubrisubalbicans]|uniref:hypothetical protein n=1 Tax=Herbaspirillum rubrisubalbicans TaxID=80842 RepID=UPI0015C57DFD|nr:hypothetical protein [Herbaspirillum rubrisubalbicans]NQE49931.1 hypothetical protein [Herbaspirillum rubrisubalbicans]